MSVPAQEVSEKEFSILPRYCSCDILVKRVVAFYTCLKTLTKAKMINIELIPLAEEISKQPSIKSVVCLLMLNIMRIYNEMEQVVQEKIFEKKKRTKKRNKGKFFVQENKEIKELNKLRN